MNENVFKKINEILNSYDELPKKAELIREIIETKAKTIKIENESVFYIPTYQMILQCSNCHRYLGVDGKLHSIGDEAKPYSETKEKCNEWIHDSDIWHKCTDGNLMCDDCYDLRGETINKAIMEKMLKIGIPQKHVYATVEKVKDKPTYNKAYMSAKNGKNIYIYGVTGVGKTSLSVCILKELLQKKIVKKALYFNEAEITVEDIEHTKNQELIIVDDIGIMKEKHEITKQILYLVVEYDVKFIAVSNMAIEKLNMFDDRIKRRLKENTKIIQL